MSSELNGAFSPSAEQDDSNAKYLDELEDALKKMGFISHFDDYLPRHPEADIYKKGQVIEHPERRVLIRQGDSLVLLADKYMAETSKLGRAFGASPLEKRRYALVLRTGTLFNPYAPKITAETGYFKSRNWSDDHDQFVGKDKKKGAPSSEDLEAFVRSWLNQNHVARAAAPLPLGKIAP